MILKNILIVISLATNSFGGAIPDGKTNVDCMLPMESEADLEPFPIFNDDNNDHLIHIETDKEKTLKVNRGESLWLSCAPNKLQKFPDKQYVWATCKNDQFLEINGEEVPYSDLQCDNSVVLQRDNPVSGCEQINQKSIEFGYFNPIKNISYIYGYVCYDINEYKINFLKGKMSMGDFNIIPMYTQPGYYFEQVVSNELAINFNKVLKNANNMVEFDDDDNNSENNSTTTISSISEETSSISSITNSTSETLKSAIAYTGVLNENRMFGLIRRMNTESLGAFMSLKTYSNKDSLLFYVGFQGTRFYWITIHDDRDAFSVILPIQNTKVSDSELCENGVRSDDLLMCPYHEIQANVAGMPRFEGQN